MGKKSSGILFHITSLPGKYGIGDIGNSSYQFIDFLEKVRCKYWQFLPVIYPGMGNSPYQGISAFAGNPFIISPDLLYQDGYIKKMQLPDSETGTNSVDFRKVKEVKNRLINQAFEKLNGSFFKSDEFQNFCFDNDYWLNNFSLYIALKRKYQNKSWPKWPKLKENKVGYYLKSKDGYLEKQVLKEKFTQFIFFKQWRKLRDYASSRGIKLIGDLPLYVAYKSADVWSQPELFKLSKNEKPFFISGVPPDFFSSTGQIWNTPVYDWEANKKSSYSWWKERIKQNLDMVDILRLDHFRGFSRYWEIPSTSKTAAKGHWEDGPGITLFDAISKDTDITISNRFLAEDLGIIDDDVISLRNKLGIPGMKIVQFEFDMDDCRFPDHVDENCFLYTGTHDNDTIKGWLNKLTQREARNLQRVTGKDKDTIQPKDVISMAWGTKAKTVIVPIQDILELGSDSRMNFPGKQDGNWGWKLGEGMINSDSLASNLYTLNQRFQRN